MANAQSLIEKIKALPPEGLDEVEDFVDFIASRAQERSLAPLPQPARRLSPRFGAIPTTTSTMPYEFGDVVLVPFPFTNQAASKKRPPGATELRQWYREAERLRGLEVDH